MSKRVEVRNLLFGLSRGLALTGAVFALLLLTCMFLAPEYMKVTFIGAMLCFALSTIISLISIFIE